MVQSKGTMTLSLTIILLCTTPTFTYGQDYSSWRPWRRASSSTRNVPPQGYYLPMSNGGAMLTDVPNTFPPGQGEPINAIISGNSDSRVLVDAETNGGLRNYFLSFGFSGECLGQHSGSDQAANLGDGDGFQNETSVIRWNYGDSQLGSCKETVEGGNHFRYWVQDGPSANSGAIFLAVSYELPLNLGHDIISNGYNFGRDWLVGNITGSDIPPNITNATTFSGTTSFGNFTYQTEITYITGLLQDTNDNINHNITVGTESVNASDGLVAILDVKITSEPAGSKSIAWKLSTPQFWQLLPLMVILVPTLVPSFSV